MKKRLLKLSLAPLLLLAPTGCMRVSNSFSGDAGLIVSPELKPVVRVLNANNCYQCHAEYSDYQTSQAWVDSGLVVAGDAAHSKLVERLRGTPSYMPPTGTVVDEASIQAIEDWINGI